MEQTKIKEPFDIQQRLRIYSLWKQQNSLGISLEFQPKQVKLFISQNHGINLSIQQIKAYVADICQMYGLEPVFKR